MQMLQPAQETVTKIAVTIEDSNRFDTAEFEIENDI